MISPEQFLPLWPETAGRRARLINHTENHTFLVDGGHVLRIHPPSRSRDAITDELRWIAELRKATGITMPEQVGPVHQIDGSPGCGCSACTGLRSATRRSSPCPGT